MKIRICKHQCQLNKSMAERIIRCGYVRVSFIAVLTAILSLFDCCKGSSIFFDDFTGQLVVTIDGLPIANGGRVSDLNFNGESVSFDLLMNGTVNVWTQTVFTKLLSPASGIVSDIFIESFVNGQGTYHVTFGSILNLPTIPNGAVDLTTIPAQTLPPYPYYKDGTVQKVGTAFFSDGSRDTFFVQTEVPEPSTLALLLTAGVVYTVRKQKIWTVWCA